MASKKVRKGTKARFHIFDSSGSSNKLIASPVIAVNEFGLIPEEELDELKKHMKTRNRVVHCENVWAVNNLYPLESGANVTLEPEHVVDIFVLAVELGYLPHRIRFQLLKRWGIKVHPDTVEHVLDGTNHRQVEVPRDLRRKWRKMAHQFGDTSTSRKRSGSRAISTEMKVDIILKLDVEPNTEIATQGIVADSTARNWWRQCRGEYKNGKPIPEDKIYPWVEEARQIIRERIEADTIDHPNRWKRIVGL